jgi:hypothetical protein
MMGRDRRRGALDEREMGRGEGQGHGHGRDPLLLILQMLDDEEPPSGYGFR